MNGNVMIDTDVIETDAFPNTNTGRAQRCLAYARALHEAFLDRDAPLPTLIIRADDSDEQTLDILAVALLQQARVLGLPVPWSAVTEQMLARVAQTFEMPLPEEVLRTALTLAERMRALHTLLQDKELTPMDVLECVEEAYSLPACVEAHGRLLGSSTSKAVKQLQLSIEHGIHAGFPPTEIAESLGIDVATVKAHGARMFPPHTLLVMDLTPLRSLEYAV